MRHGRFWRFLAVAAAAVGISACGVDRATAPTVPDAPATGLLSDLLGDVLGELTRKQALTRTAPLARDIAASATIDHRGGTITVPGTGFTLIVPPYAVKEPVKFTVTAVAGRVVAYEFQPHGTTFDVPLIARQDLDGTTYSFLKLKPLVGAYFEDRRHIDQARATALVSEILRGFVLPLTRQFTFPIDHFSGYIAAY